MDFNETEKGTDNTFDNLSNEAKQLCFDSWERVKHTTSPINTLVRELDASIEFRRAIGCLNENKLPQQTDAVVRYFKWVMESGK